MNGNFKVLISICALVAACGGSNSEPNTADDMSNTAPAPAETQESVPPESSPPSDGVPSDGASPGSASPTPSPTPPTSMKPADAEMLSARSSFAMPAEAANAGKTGYGGKTGKSGTTGGSSSSTGGASSKSE